jgi:hypothetical protein
VIVYLLLFFKIGDEATLVGEGSREVRGQHLPGSLLGLEDLVGVSVHSDLLVIYI